MPARRLRQYADSSVERLRPQSAVGEKCSGQSLAVGNSVALPKRRMSRKRNCGVAAVESKDQVRVRSPVAFAGRDTVSWPVMPRWITQMTIVRPER